MTTLNRKVKREAARRLLPRAIIIELEPPNFIRLREKGRRKAFETTIEALYMCLAKEDADRTRERKRKRSARCS